MGANQTETDERVRLNGPCRHDEHEVAHDGQHRVVRAGALSEKVGRVRDVFLESEDAPRRPDRCAPVETLLVAAGQAGAVGGIAPEVESDKRTDEAVGARGRHGPGDERRGKNEYSEWMQGEPPLSYRLWIGRRRSSVMHRQR